MSSYLKPIGIACLVLCAVCIFVAVERYNANSSNVAAMRSMTGALGDALDLRPAVPTETKYASFFAALSALIGGVCLLRARPAAKQGE